MLGLPWLQIYQKGEIQFRKFDFKELSLVIHGWANNLYDISNSNIFNINVAYIWRTNNLNHASYSLRVFTKIPFKNVLLWSQGLEIFIFFLLWPEKRSKAKLLKTSKKEHNWHISTFDHDENCCFCWRNRNTFWNVKTTQKDQGALLNGIAESIKKGNFYHRSTTPSLMTQFSKMHSASKEEMW